MPKLINMVAARNRAAEEFEQEHLLDEQGNFSFERLIPIPPILRQCLTPQLVTKEELLQLKEQDDADRAFLEQGLLNFQPNGHFAPSCFTKECEQHLLAQYGATSREQFTLKFWGIIGDPVACPRDQDAHVFFTWQEVPYPFMKALAQRCPKGRWYWSCELAEHEEVLDFALKTGKVILTEHWMRKDYRLCLKDFYWDDEGGVRAITQGTTALSYEQRRYSVKLKHEIT